MAEMGIWIPTTKGVINVSENLGNSAQLIGNLVTTVPANSDVVQYDLTGFDPNKHFFHYRIENATNNVLSRGHAFSPNMTAVQISLTWANSNAPREPKTVYFNKFSYKDVTTSDMGVIATNAVGEVVLDNSRAVMMVYGQGTSVGQPNFDGTWYHRVSYPYTGLLAVQMVNGQYVNMAKQMNGTNSQIIGTSVGWQTFGDSFVTNVQYVNYKILRPAFEVPLTSQCGMWNYTANGLCTFHTDGQIAWLRDTKSITSVTGSDVYWTPAIAPNWIVVSGGGMTSFNINAGASKIEQVRTGGTVWRTGNTLVFTTLQILPITFVAGTVPVVCTVIETT